MKTWRRAVMELPEAERLEQALFWLEELTGGEPDVAAVQQRLGCSPSVAQVIAALSAASPRVLSQLQLYRLLFPTEDECDLKLPTIYVCKARKFLPAGAIVTHWAMGYSMPAPLDVVCPAPGPQAQGLTIVNSARVKFIGPAGEGASQ